MIPDLNTNPLEVKPEHQQYRVVEIRLILPDAAAFSLMQFINGDNPFRPYLFGRAQGSGLLSYVEAEQMAAHYRRKPNG